MIIMVMMMMMIGGDNQEPVSYFSREIKHIYLQGRTNSVVNKISLSLFYSCTIFIIHL